MATQFKVWIDSPDDTAGGNVMSQSNFASDSQRTSGYASGQTISSKRLNTILRQTSLVMVALMDQFCPSSTVTLMSSLANVKTALGNAIATKSSVDTLSTTVTSQGTQLSALQNTVDNIISSSSETIPAISARVTNIENGTTVVPNAANAINAINAMNDVDGNAIKSRYAASLDVSNATITLKAKDGTQLSSKTINNVANASQAAKLGGSDVGTSKKFIYLVGGTPIATTDSIGSSTQPIYMSEGEIRPSSATVGAPNVPVYMLNGVIRSTDQDLSKMMQDLNIDINDHEIFNFIAGDTYTWAQIQGSTFYNAINSIFESYPTGVYPVSMYQNTPGAVNFHYYTGALSKIEHNNPDNTMTRVYSLNIKSIFTFDEFSVVVRSNLNDGHMNISCIRVYWDFTQNTSVGLNTSSIVNTLSVSTTESGTAREKSIEWTQNK